MAIVFIQLLYYRQIILVFDSYIYYNFCLLEKIKYHLKLDIFFYTGNQFIYFFLTITSSMKISHKTSKHLNKLISQNNLHLIFSFIILSNSRVIKKLRNGSFPLIIDNNLSDCVLAFFNNSDSHKRRFFSFLK